MNDLKKIAAAFAIDGTFVEAAPYSTGHINDTYSALYKTSVGDCRYIFQKINTAIFQQPVALMENVERVTAHLRGKIEAVGGDPVRETLTLVPAVDNKVYYDDPEAGFWRVYVFIESARTYDLVTDLDMVFEASRAFGVFQKKLADIPGGRLNETIPGFHHSKNRFNTFQNALAADVENRAATVKGDVEFVLSREGYASKLIDLLESGELPERVTHNDTKFNNVMIDDTTKKGICVIDLDTVMPGLAMYDFGDSARIGTSTAVEDEKDLSKVNMDIRMFDQLSKGYLNVAREFLTPLEIENLAFSAKLMTFEVGMRFLTDYLQGDKYFKVHRESHNVDRCRTQFKMVSDMEAQMGDMEAIVQKYAKG